MKLIAILALAATASACKCYLYTHPSQRDLNTTIYCCGKYKGKVIGDDCQAHSIKDHFKEFWNCCWDQHENYVSDCRGNFNPDKADETDEIDAIESLAPEVS